MLDRHVSPSGVQESDDGLLPLFCHKASMLDSFVVLGEFWEAGATSPFPPSAGVMRWEPYGDSSVSVVTLDGSTGIASISQRRGDPVCLQGRWMANIDGAQMRSAYFSVEAVVSGGSERFAGLYGRTERWYDVMSVWEGARTIVSSEARFSQMGFTLRGLERWIGHRLDISDWKNGWRVLYDFAVSDVGRASLLAGYDHEGVNGEKETFTASHMWQIDFASPRTWAQCRDLLSNTAERLSEMAECPLAIESLILTEHTAIPSDSDRFNVMIRNNSPALEMQNQHGVFRSEMQDAEPSCLADAFSESAASVIRTR